MTASTAVRAPRTFPLLARFAGAARARSAEALVFSAATAVALLHALDDAFLLPGPGVPLGQHALAAAIAVVASIAAILAFPRLRPGLRSATAFVFGALATINGGRHAHHILAESATANDVTGALALVAGLVLLGLAAYIPFRHRGEGVANPVGRWALRVGVPAGFVVAAVTVFGPVGMAMTDIHSLEKPLGDPPNAAYKTVHFTASDGVELEGWYRPSRNGASVLVLSGGGSNRMGPLRHAKMLERHGYGVLVYDPRGSGNSEGTVNSYGWGWDKDADAALDFLAKRADVDPGRIGALGLSTGADIAIDAAGRRDDVKAVVADGSAAIGYEDIKEYSAKSLDRQPMWVLFKTIELIQGRSQPKVSLADRIAHTSAPHLLVSAGKQEKEWGELYDRAGGERSELWHLPKASHTAALKQYPEAYEQRVAAFFDRNL
ncbi:MAG: alpha/beta hydrolase [Actinomycetota bacterium]|nr:alpha/beta hydrolase [Actinomycetota bacterium]